MSRMRRRKTPMVQPAARARALTLQAAQRASRARMELAIVVPLIVGFLLLFHYREDVLGIDLPVRIVSAIALVILGWRLARDVGRTLAPSLFRRMDPATAGTVGFIIRLTFLVAAVLVALNIAGLEPRTLAVSGAIVAVIFGLASQQRPSPRRTGRASPTRSSPRSPRSPARGRRRSGSRRGGTPTRVPAARARDRRRTRRATSRRSTSRDSRGQTAPRTTSAMTASAAASTSNMV